jgi:alpha-2-macroglobulin
MLAARRSFMCPVRIIAAWMLAILLLSGCNGGDGTDPSSPHPPDRDDAPMELTLLEAFPGRLSEGARHEDPPPRTRLADTEPLEAERVRELLERLAPLQPEIEDERDFALREDSEPPPRAGAVIRDEFPPESERRPPAPEHPEGSVRVLRFSPEGEVPIAGQVSVTFDRPMVAVSAHDDLAAGDVPVELNPEPAGHWRWVGTRTVVFEPTNARLPMATEYEVRVPAGVRAADGSELDDTLSWRFATPPPTLKQVYPSGSSIGLEPLMFAAFDQRIDADAMLETLVIEAGGEPLEVRRATADELAADHDLGRALGRLDPQRFVAFRARETLEPATTVSIRLPEGSLAAEGPRPTTSEQSSSFRTYGPLRVTSQRCASRDCHPREPLFIGFSNQLDAQQDLAGLVTVEPPIADMHVEWRGANLVIEGIMQGRTDYTVTLSEVLTDVFGQRLQGERELRFETGSLRAYIGFPGRGLVTLPAGGPAELAFHAVNYRDARVQVQRVKPEEWPDFAELLRGRRAWRDEPPELPGETLFDDNMELASEADRTRLHRIDLAPWLSDAGTGHFVVMLEPGATIGAERAWGPPRHIAWVQVTGIGLDAAVDGERILAWVTDLADGSPLADHAVRLEPAGGAASSDNDGLVTLDLAAARAQPSDTSWLEARSGEDLAILPEADSHWRHTNWRPGQRQDQVLWHVFDDRAMYRPGEQVHMKGWVRQEHRRPDGGLGLIDGRLTLRYEVLDARGNTLAEGESEVGRLGGFDLAFDLPDTPNLGHARVRLNLAGSRQLDGTSHSHTFQIQEFRTPEFEVTTQIPEGPFIGSTTVAAEVQAAYYAGGALAGADTHWLVMASPGHYRPPNRDDWTFGVDIPWWMPWPVLNDRQAVQERFEGSTDGGGSHALDIELGMSEQQRPLAMTASATVMDVNRQAWSASSSFIAHPAATYVGLKTERQFVEQGEPFTVEMITVDLDGEVAADRPVTVEAARIQWQWRRDERHEQRADVQRCEVRTDADGLAECEFVTRLGGQYRITAVTRDEQGRRNATRLTRWVGGGRLPAADRVEMQEVLLIPDHEEYAPRDTARVLVQAPFEDAEGLLTLRRHGIAEQRRFRIDGGSKTLEIELREAWMPGIELHVTLAGQAEMETGTRPAVASGRIDLPISKAERALAIELAPKHKQLSPGAGTAIELQVRDAAGEPVADAEVALIVVDEAVLALTGYELVDPLAVFWRQRPGGVRDHHLRTSVLLPAPPEDAAQDKQVAYEAEMAVADGEVMRVGTPYADDAADAIDIREDFNPLADFLPALRTDAAGRISAEISLPDNLTRYRIMAVAVAGATHYGKAESAITARLPLMVRPSAPRFLNFGDRFELPVVLQNQTDEAMRVEIALDASNLELAGDRGYALDVPANDRVEVRFPAAARQAGTARFQVAATAGDHADAARGQLPVWTPATTEAFATYGVIDEGAMVQPVIAPAEIWPQFGQLEITTSATALQSLTDAFIWLCDYPFNATEPLASRLIAIAALADVLDAFGAEGMPTRDEIGQIVQADLERISARQNSDGGFGLWQRGDESWPFVSLHVAHALIRLREKDYPVDEQLFERTLGHVRDIERHIPSRYSQRTRRHIVAYSLYLRGLEGDFDRPRARALLAEVDGPAALTFEATGWLLGVFSGDETYADELATLRRFLANRVTETAAAAHFVSDFQDGDHLIMHSNRRADAIILEALMRDQPDSDLIPKLVQGLQGHRTRGRWSSTQENAFVLLALDRYFRQYEDQEPDFIARAWLGERLAGEHHFAGRTTDYHHVDIPMAHVAAGDGEHDIVLDKDGAGRLYYRLGLRYAPRSLELEPASHGFDIERHYRAMDDEDDVRQRDDGSWEIRAGARVAVEVTLVAPTRRYHVALVDPFAAGLEVINPALAVSEPAGDSNDERPGFHGWWWGPWYQHQNLRDERAEAFTTLLPGGVYSYTYHVRATTPGEYVVPPAKVEEMYHPETFGRSASTRVIVVD